MPATLKHLHIPKILLLASTNNACDVPEKSILIVLPVFGQAEEVRMDILPACRRLEGEEIPQTVLVCVIRMMICYPSLVNFLNTVAWEVKEIY